jgi:nitrate reductase beta subunit
LEAFSLALMLLCSAASVSALPSVEPTVEELKAKLSAAQVSDKVHICVQIAQKQVGEVDRFYAAGDTEKAQPALTDVVAFSELARDYSIQSNKHQKQTEIAVRGLTRKLTDLMHSLPQDEEGPVRDAITRLQRVRDDLLLAMFPKGGKK